MQDYRKTHDLGNYGPNRRAEKCVDACTWFALPLSSPEIRSVIFWSYLAHPQIVLTRQQRFKGKRPMTVFGVSPCGFIGLTSW